MVVFFNACKHLVFSGSPHAKYKLFGKQIPRHYTPGVYLLTLRIFVLFWTWAANNVFSDSSYEVFSDAKFVLRENHDSKLCFFVHKTSAIDQLHLLLRVNCAVIQMELVQCVFFIANEKMLVNVIRLFRYASCVIRSWYLYPDLLFKICHISH